MVDHETRLRPAIPDRAEGLLFARYLDQAADGFFGLLLGRDAPNIIATVFPEPGHSLSWEHVVVAERDGVVVGMSSAFTGAQHRTFSDEPLEQAAGRRALRMKTVGLLLAPMLRILETIAEDDFYLQAIAVDPDVRGAGVGSVLLDDVVERGTRNESARLSLDVAAKNEGARRLYARRGFGESSEWPSSRFLPTILIRMTKPL